MLQTLHMLFRKIEEEWNSVFCHETDNKFSTRMCEYPQKPSRRMNKMVDRF